MRLRPRRRCILRHITHLSGLIFGLGLPPVRPFRTCHVLRDMRERRAGHFFLFNAAVNQSPLSDCGAEGRGAGVALRLPPTPPGER